jgi:hypothetical protein
MSYQTFTELITTIHDLMNKRAMLERAIAGEVVKATKDELGEPGREFAEILELA